MVYDHSIIFIIFKNIQIIKRNILYIDEIEKNMLTFPLIKLEYSVTLIKKERRCDYHVTC